MIERYGDETRHQDAKHFLTGARAAYDIRLGERLRLRAHLDVYARLIQVRLTIDGATAWTSGLGSGTFGLSLLRFF